MNDWHQAVRMVAWLDRKNGHDDHELLQRLTKLSEETGEVMAAYAGMNANNPRKGWTHTREEVLNEICDVVFAGMVALVSWCEEESPSELLSERIRFKVERALQHE